MTMFQQLSRRYFFSLKRFDIMAGGARVVATGHLTLL